MLPLPESRCLPPSLDKMRNFLFLPLSASIFKSKAFSLAPSLNSERDPVSSSSVACEDP